MGHAAALCASGSSGEGFRAHLPAFLPGGVAGWVAEEGGPEPSSGVGSWVDIAPFDLGSRGQQARPRSQLSLVGSELGGSGLIAGALPPCLEPSCPRSRGRGEGPLWSLYSSPHLLYFMLFILLKKLM